MLKVFKLITSAAGNIHTFNGHVENVYQLWKSFYAMISQLGSTAQAPAPVAVAEAQAEETPLAPAAAGPTPVAL